MDKDKNGEITKEEYQKYMKNNGNDLTDEQVSAIFN